MLLIICMSASVSAKPNVYYAGFAYLGDYKNIERNYPYTAVLNRSNGAQSYLDKVLYDLIKNQTFPNFDLRIGEQIADLHGSAIALVFALDRESTSVEQIGNQYKVITELSAQALFFNHQQQMLINSYPVVVQYIDVLNQYPDEAYFRTSLDRLYTGDGEINIFRSLIRRLTDVVLDHAVQARIQVSQVDLEDNAIKALPERYTNDPESYRKYLASTFTAYLSKNQKVPMLPYSKGHALGNKIAFTVANGEVFNLKIPDPDYEIRLTVRGFKKALIETTPVESAWAYGTYINIEVLEPLSGTRYINARFMNAASKTVPVSQTNIDDWAAYQETLLGLFDSLTKEVANPTRDWTKSHSPSKDVAEQLNRFNKVLKQCA